MGLIGLVISSCGIAVQRNRGTVQKRMSERG